MLACVLLSFAGVPGSAQAPDALPIGYVCHFPLVKHEDDTIRDTGASVLIVRAPWALVEPEEGSFDFSLLDQQLAWADTQKLRLVWVIEAGPAHAAGVPWLIEKLQAADETIADQAGNKARDPSIFSPLYRQYLSRYIRRTVEYLAAHPLNHVVYGYDNGCEWWYQLHLGYGAPDAAAFREELRRRYGSLGALNRRWGTRFESWEAVHPPGLVSDGMSDLPQGRLVPASAAVDACYCTQEGTHVPVTPGQRYTLEIECDTTGLVSGAVRAEIAWLGPTDPRPQAIVRSAPFVAATESAILRLEATAPEGAARAWLLPKLQGVGKVVLRSVRFTNDQGSQLAPNPTLDPAAGGWQFIRWSAGEPEKVEHEWLRAGEAWISYTPSCKLESGAEWPLAEVYDWLDFRYRSVAGFLDWFAGEIKAADPAHPVVTYLTMSFANPFEWDYVEHMAIALDYIGRQSAHQDILGMQLASAAGDYDSVTCALDMVRKYGKPMWAIDLLDFSLGVGLGPHGLTRTSLSVVQHGGSGIQYYCWFGTPVYNYSELGVPALRGMIGEVQDAAAQLAGARPECDVALVMPRMPLYQFLPEPHNDWADFMGWYKLLVRMGVCPDVYTLEELPEANLGRYRAVIVPDCAYIPASAVRTLMRLSGSATTVLTSGRFARRDMSGRPLPESARAWKRIAFEEAVGAAVLGDAYRHPSPTDTPPRLTCRPGALGLELPIVGRIERELAEAGVRILHRAGEAPVTSVPFSDGQRRQAFVLPDSEWAGTVNVTGDDRYVGLLGEVVEMP